MGCPARVGPGEEGALVAEQRRIQHDEMLVLRGKVRRAGKLMPGADIEAAHHRGELPRAVGASVFQDLFGPSAPASAGRDGPSP